MATVFFKISEVQDKEVKRFMKEEGYTNRAEFFRFLVKFYRIANAPLKSDLDRASDELADTIRELDRQGKIPHLSLDEQLADL